MICPVTEQGVTSPTDEDWQEAITRFRFFRRLEDPVVLRLAKRLPRVLTEEADAIYRIADKLERTGKLEKDLADYGVSAIAERLRDDYAFEVRSKFVPLEFLEDLSEQPEPSPSALREYAAIIHNGADRAQLLIDKYLECVEWLREAAEKTRGRYPSVSMFWLIWTTDQWGSTIPEIARRLVENGALPETESSEPDPVAQWQIILKKGRTRARERGTE